MQISQSIKEFFCKNYNLNIKIFKDPYFEDRLKTFEYQYQAYSKWIEFLDEIKEFKTEEDYFKFYNKIQNKIIDYIKSRKEYKVFEELDESIFKYEENAPKETIYKNENNKKTFLSIDLRKACFQAVYSINPSIFDDKNEWEDFISKFTNKNHLINSKPFRQYIFSQLEPQKQAIIEHFLLEPFYSLFSEFSYKIVNFTHDEIIIELPKDYKNYITPLQIELFRYAEKFGIDIHLDVFRLIRFKKTDVFIKSIVNKNKYEIKCADSNILPIVLKYINDEEIKEEDYYTQIADSIVKIDFPKSKVPNLKRTSDILIY